jgi:hypothetical protein
MGASGFFVSGIGPIRTVPMPKNIVHNKMFHKPEKSEAAAQCKEMPVISGNKVVDKKE